MSELPSATAGGMAGPAPPKRKPGWKWLLLLLLPLLIISHLLCILVGVWLSPVLGPRVAGGNKQVTKATFEMIKPDMTYAEVQELFGDKGEFVKWEGRELGYGWYNGASSITIYFDTIDNKPYRVTRKFATRLE